VDLIEGAQDQALGPGHGQLIGIAAADPPFCSVAGSPMVPTNGSANPTLTIDTLWLRLADHLKATQMSSGSTNLGRGKARDVDNFRLGMCHCDLPSGAQIFSHTVLVDFLGLGDRPLCHSGN
jgi:hypothetical protein